MVNSKILPDIFEGESHQFYELNTSQTIISADESSKGKCFSITIDVRPRLTKHGAPTKTAAG